MIISRDKKQIITATLFGIFFLCIQLQKGKNNVAKIPPIHNGIRKSFAKYNPRIIKKTKASFCKKVEDEVLMI